MDQPVADKMMHRATHYWFPRRHYGWGWGCPRCWQGWAVLLSYAVALLSAHHLLADQQGTWVYTLAVLGLSGVLVWICYIKGEPPHWSWGKDTGPMPPPPAEPPQDEA